MGQVALLAVGVGTVSKTSGDNYMSMRARTESPESGLTPMSFLLWHSTRYGARFRRESIDPWPPSKRTLKSLVEFLRPVFGEPARYWTSPKDCGYPGARYAVWVLMEGHMYAHPRCGIEILLPQEASSERRAWETWCRIRDAIQTSRRFAKKKGR